MKILVLFLTILLSTAHSFAQGNDVEMATGLRSSGKIYVVIIVICIILLGLVAYLFSIDRRLKKLEDKE